MQTTLIYLGSSALISFLLILPFMVMEIVNRRNYHEDFPSMLFFVMWFNLFAISLVLLPIVRGRRKSDHDTANPVPAQGNTLLTNPRSAALISIVLFLSVGILPVLDSLGWVPLDAWANGPNPERFYLPGIFFTLGLFLITLAAGVVASGPVASTLRAGGSLFAHPINLIIIVFFVSALSFGVASLIIDQWPCFIGVPMCD